MTIRHCAALLIAVLALSLFSGCGLDTALRKADALEDAVEHRIDTAEEAVETAVETAVKDALTPDKPAALTAAEAEAIALSHAGFTSEQVRFLRSEFEIDDRIPQYDIQFMGDKLEYEYEVHAETGAILSLDRDH